MRVGASFVSEEFAGDQLGRHGTHVDRHQRFVLAVAAIVNRFSDEILSRSGLAGNQYGNVGGCGIGNLLEDLEHRQADAQHPFELVEGRQV